MTMMIDWCVIIGALCAGVAYCIGLLVRKIEFGKRKDPPSGTA